MPGNLAPIIAMLCGVVIAFYFGTLIGGSDTTELLLIGLALLCVGVLAFVGDYWWAPLVLISALTFRTNFLGFIMTGMDIGIVALAVLLPLKMAIRRLRPIEPSLKIGLSFKLLLSFIAIHAVVIVLYSKFHGVPLKNIIKSYYSVLTPLIFYGLLVRYCKPRTMKPVTIWTFAIYAFVVAVSIPVIWLGVVLPFFYSRHFLFDWTHAAVAVGAVRAYSPLLLAAMIAVFPAARSPIAKIAVILVFGLSLCGTLVSSSRVAILLCLGEILIFCILRRKLWLLAPLVVLVAITIMVISNNPNLLYQLPVPMHRALTPFNVSSHHTSVQSDAELSDRWHADLERESFSYWTSDLWAFLVGHGFKAWDESLGSDAEFTRYYEDAKKMAVQMGRPENMLNGISNIFGLTGIVLFACLFWHLFSELRMACRAVPIGSYERALCEFSIVTLVVAVLASPWAGAIPGINLTYYAFGLLAARASYAKLQRPAVETRNVDVGVLPARAAAY